MADAQAISAELKSALGAIMQSRYPASALGRAQLDDDLHLGGHMLKPAVQARSIDGHGITKISVFSNMDQLVDLLTNGVDAKRAFSTAALATPAAMGSATGTASGGPYAHGPFIVISDPKKGLQQPVSEGGGIKAVLVNPVVKDLIPVLQKHFPQTPFVTYDKVNDYLFSLGVIDEATRKVADAEAARTRQAVEAAIHSPKLEEHDWKIHSYNGTKGKQLSMTLTSGDIAGARAALEERGIGSDIISRDGSRLLVMSSSDAAERLIAEVAKAKGVDAAALLR